MRASDSGGLALILAEHLLVDWRNTREAGNRKYRGAACKTVTSTHIPSVCTCNLQAALFEGGGYTIHGYTFFTPFICTSSMRSDIFMMTSSGNDCRKGTLQTQRCKEGHSETIAGDVLLLCGCCSIVRHNVDTCSIKHLNVALDQQDLGDIMVKVLEHRAALWAHRASNRANPLDRTC